MDASGQLYSDPEDQDAHETNNRALEAVRLSAERNVTYVPRRVTRISPRLLSYADAQDIATRSLDDSDGVSRDDQAALFAWVQLLDEDAIVALDESRTARVALQIQLDAALAELAAVRLENSALTADIMRATDRAGRGAE